MAQQFRYAGPFNGYLPQATGLVVAFIRKPDDFPMNRYVQYIPMTVKNGAYIQIETDQMVREVDDNTLSWEDGASRKQMGNDNKVGFQFVPIRTHRRNRAWTLGWQTIEQTKDFKIKPLHMDTAISQIMVARTQRLVTLMESSSNWTSTNSGTANTLNNGAGKWSDASDDPNSENYNAIFKTMLAVSQVVHLFTNGKIKPGDLRCVVDPVGATKIAVSAEMTNYCRESPYSKAILEEGLDPQYQRWGLPKQYKGFEFVVEDTMRVSQQANATATQATTNRAYIKTTGLVNFVSRVGGLDGEYGTENYSSIALGHYGPLLQVEAFDDPEDHLIRGHVSEDTVEYIPTNLGGFLVTGAI